MYSFPGFSSLGTGVFKTRFLETDPRLPVRYGGYAQLEWIGSNRAQLLLRDLDLDYKSIRFDPFSSTTEGLLYSVTLKDESQRSIYKNVGNRIEHVGGLLLASDNDTVVFRDILKGLVPNISVIKPGGVATLLGKKDDPVPGDECTRITATAQVPSDGDGRLFLRLSVVDRSSNQCAQVGASAVIS